MNLDWYARPEAVASFSGHDLLEPTLVMLLVRYRDWILDRKVLDMGVGPGRTTAYLSRLASGYVGIDYSSSMVEHCVQRFPTTRLELGDARDLSRFEPQTFDFVLFSYAAIGALDHEGRLRVFSEVRRVLHPKGLFAPSSAHPSHLLPDPNCPHAYSLCLPPPATSLPPSHRASSRPWRRQCAAIRVPSASSLSCPY